jgi:two-component system sensor histidine kinase/response regulator
MVEAPHQESAAVPEVMDREAALALVEGDEELLGEMASLFLKDSDLALTTIRRALEQADLRRTAREAHALKGSLASLAATEARDTTEEIEALAICGERSKAAQACNRLESALARLRPVLQDLAHPVES